MCIIKGTTHVPEKEKNKKRGGGVGGGGVSDVAYCWVCMHGDEYRLFCLPFGIEIGQAYFS